MQIVLGALTIVLLAPCVFAADKMALLNAAQSGDVAAADAALADGADINYQHPGNGQSPLMAAVLGGKPAIVKLMLECVTPIYVCVLLKLRH
jgi:ankyrin repeat protein